jgi:hypothetical protein
MQTRRTIREDVGTILRDKLHAAMLLAGPSVIHKQQEIGDIFKSFDESPGPRQYSLEFESLYEAWCCQIPHRLLELAGKLPAEQLFEQVMRPIAFRPYPAPYIVARWAIETWGYALKEHLPETGLKFGQPGQDRTAYVELRQPNRPRLEIIEAKIKEMFHIELSPVKVRRRQKGSRSRRNGYRLQYPFGRAADSREYLDWSYGHRMSNDTYGRVYEDGEQVTFGASIF